MTPTTNGWQYDRWVGQFGGWRRPNGATEQVVCRTRRKGGPWCAAWFRPEDGSKLYEAIHPTRDEAMRAIEARPYAD